LASFAILKLSEGESVVSRKRFPRAGAADAVSIRGTSEIEVSLNDANQVASNSRCE